MIEALILSAMLHTTNPYYEIIEETCEEYQICPELIDSIIYEESRYQPDVSNGNCIGLGQINKKVHKKRMDKLEVDDLYDPEQNILVMVDLISDLFKEYEDVGMVIDAYRGDLHSTAWYEAGNMTSASKRILQRSEDLEREHEK